MSNLSASTTHTLDGKNILITGAARRIGLSLALAAAAEGANIVLHYNCSAKEAKLAAQKIQALGAKAYLLQADLYVPAESERIVVRAVEMAGPLFGLVNNASIFQGASILDTTLEVWSNSIAVHLNAPFILSQAFAKALPEGETGRIVNMLDWRALRPGADHFAYTVSKAGLAAFTRSAAAALAPRISVNGLALGAILPPENEPADENLIRRVPAHRWGEVSEVQEAFLFLMAGPAYITGEILHIDGGRHLV